MSITECLGVAGLGPAWQGLTWQDKARFLMPYAARKRCPIPGCPGLTADEQPCERHVRFTERVYDAQWRYIRLMVLKRDQDRCRECGKPGNEVDHIRSVRLGGKTALVNLQTLCKRCHSAKTHRGQ